MELKSKIYENRIKLSYLSLISHIAADKDINICTQYQSTEKLVTPKLLTQHDINEGEKTKPFKMKQKTRNLFINNLIFRSVSKIKGRTDVK